MSGLLVVREDRIKVEAEARAKAHRAGKIHHQGDVARAVDRLGGGRDAREELVSEDVAKRARQAVRRDRGRDRGRGRIAGRRVIGVERLRGLVVVVGAVGELKLR